MLLKLLGDDGKFDILARVRTCKFTRIEDKSYAIVTFEPSGLETMPQEAQHQIHKTAFVLDDAGNTLDKFNHLGR